MSDGSPPPELSEVVYAQLRAIAQVQMAGERRAHTLSATALVHEVYLKLGPSVAPSDRASFYHAAAGAMRRILIDYARQRGTVKRGGGGDSDGNPRARTLLDIESVADLAVAEDPEEILALDGAISRLESEDPDAAGVVRLRFFAGLSGDQAADVLGISPRQADREWSFARAFLLRALRPDPES